MTHVQAKGGRWVRPDSTDQASQPFAAAQEGMTPAAEHVARSPQACLVPRERKSENHVKGAGRPANVQFRR